MRSSQSASTKHGYMRSTKRQAGHTLTVHITNNVIRHPFRRAVTRCGIMMDRFELYDVIDDVPNEIEGNRVTMCRKCELFDGL